MTAAGRRCTASCSTGTPKTAGYLYQSVLRAELTERLHVRWNAVEHGTADIAGVPRDVIEHFSQRRAEVLAHMAARGEHSARAAQIATLETRRRKEYDVPADRLRDEWRARAAEHGLDRFRLRQVLAQPPRRVARDDLAAERLARRLEGPHGLTRDQSRFTRRDVLQAFAEAARTANGSSSWSAGRLLPLPAGGRRVAPTTAASGATRPASCSHSSAGCSTAPPRAAAARQASRAGRRTARRGRLGRRSAQEQRQVVQALTQSGDGVQVLRAAAGTTSFARLDRGFAAGDRVVTTRNDRSSALSTARPASSPAYARASSRSASTTAAGSGLPEPYVRAGHLDHGYALTAHRAQGATVDRAFVLGSDELYREWGYTALSRHRIEARFYVTATPTYVNQPPAPLEPGPDVTAKVARMLAGSGAKTIAAQDTDELRAAAVLGARLQQLRRAREHRWYARRRADLSGASRLRQSSVRRRARRARSQRTSRVRAAIRSPASNARMAASGRGIGREL